MWSGPWSWTNTGRHGMLVSDWTSRGRCRLQAALRKPEGLPGVASQRFPTRWRCHTARCSPGAILEATLCPALSSDPSRAALSPGTQTWMSPLYGEHGGVLKTTAETSGSQGEEPPRMETEVLHGWFRKTLLSRDYLNACPRVFFFVFPEVSPGVLGNRTGDTGRVAHPGW